MLAPLHHAALRHSDLHGNLNSGGLGVVSWSSALTQHIVVFNNSIHDNGECQRHLRSGCARDLLSVPK